MPDKTKLGIFGSASGDIAVALPLAIELGKALKDYKEELILITGACPGLPYAVIKETEGTGMEVWGFSSSTSEKYQKSEYPDDDLSLYSNLTYVPADFPFSGNIRACKKYRNVVATASCETAIIISGRWGTLNEFTNLIDLEKTIGILTGTGGAADEIHDLSKKIHKTGQGKIIFDNNPAQLIKRLLETLNA